MTFRLLLFRFRSNHCVIIDTWFHLSGFCLIYTCPWLCRILFSLHNRRNKSEDDAFSVCIKCCGVFCPVFLMHSIGLLISIPWIIFVAALYMPHRLEQLKLVMYVIFIIASYGYILQTNDKTGETLACVRSCHPYKYMAASSYSCTKPNCVR